MEGGGCLEIQNSISLGPKSAESRVLELQSWISIMEVITQLRQEKKLLLTQSLILKNIPKLKPNSKQIRFITLNPLPSKTDPAYKVLFLVEELHSIDSFFR